MKLDETAVTDNPPRLPSPDPLGERGCPPWTAFTLMFEGIGVGGTIAAISLGVLGAVMAIGTSLALPLSGGQPTIVPGPVFGGLTGAGFGAIVGGTLGGLTGVIRVMLRRS